MLSALCLLLLTAQSALDLTRATVVTSANATKRQEKAAALLVEEVERRTGIRWSLAKSAPAGRPAIALAAQPGAPPEGFTNRAEAARNRVTVTGSDDRGVLFGVGHLLRTLDLRPGKATLRADYAITTAPETKLRGHQLGYRPKTNSYDGWDIPQWEQYIRDLIVFGANAVELIPPRSDDDPSSPHFPRPQMEMMIAMSRILDDYGLDVWIWYPAMDDDYSNPKTVEFALAEWAEVFRKLPRVDAVLVPAGDPGHTPAPILLPFLEKQTANLKKFHPKAQLWLAQQGFDAKSLDFFFDAMARRPAWLSGIVYGPQIRVPLAELRRRLPREIPIRLYPDITHSRQSQYPVPDWDTAWALTSSREPINPRPLDQRAIFLATQPHTIGFITYSEGCNDDVNKAVWSALGWRRDTPVIETLREFARYFMGPAMEDDFAHALLALERNWRGPALTNIDVPTTLAQFQSLERRATPAQLSNWRFQQALYRAYYDAYVQRRLVHETAVESRALEALRAPDSRAAIAAAARILDESEINPAPQLRLRVYQLAEALFQSIRMQSSVTLHRAMAGRGNTLDTVDIPLNARAWLRDEFARIEKLSAEKDRQAALAHLAAWSDPGPGGFYDDLGNAARQPHLVAGAPYAEDPQFFRAPVVFFNPAQRGPRSWWDMSMALYELPLQLHYPDLDPRARYRVRVVYGAGPLRLAAGGRELHGYLEKPWEVLEFDVPEEATRDGALHLAWNRPPGAGGPGRGCQVAEVWLVKR